jgi:hypothetical protein
MTNCWAVLAISPTNDIDAISKARRALIRRWHPDRVSGSVQKHFYTARCARINVAHDEAVKLASMARKTPRFETACHPESAGPIRFYSRPPQPLTGRGVFFSCSG